VAFTTVENRYPFRSFYQPVDDLRYEVNIIDAGTSEAIASYTVTVFGVDGLAFGLLANLGRRLSPTIPGPTPLANAKAPGGAAAKGHAHKGVAVGLGDSSSSATGSQGPRSAKPTFAPAPTIPAHWGQ
jgi:hypothetical protein